MNLNRVSVFSLALTVGLVFGLPASAGEDDLYFFTISDEDGQVGGTAEVEITLDFADGDSLTGYSMAVCHDIDFVSVTTDDIVNGAAVDDMVFVLHLPAARGDDGWTVGAAFSVAPPFLLDPEDDLQMYLVTYELLAQGDALLEWCELGDPLIENAVLDPDLLEIKEDGALGLTDGSISVTDVIPFLFTLPGTSEEPVVVEYRPDDGIASVTVAASITEVSESPDFPNDTQGFSMGIRHDPDLLTPTGVTEIGPLSDLRDGDGPEFVGVNLAASDTGVTVAVAYVLLGDATLEFEEQTDVLQISYDVVENALVDNLDGETTTLEFVDDLGSPTVRNAVVVGGFSDKGVTFEDGQVRFEPILVPPFIRGDCNSDGLVNIGDGIFWLRFLFQEGATPVCFEACDVVDDDNDQVGDAIKLFNYLFSEGPAPPAPFPDCGTPEETEVRCESHDCEDG